MVNYNKNQSSKHQPAEMSYHNDRLPEEITPLVTSKIRKGVRNFLHVSQYVSSKNTQKLAQFDHNELVLGGILGSGGFSHVIEIKAFCPRHKGVFNSEEDELRSNVMCRSFDNNSSNRKNNKRGLVVKHMKEKFLDMPSKFKSAGTDLVIEAHFLASLQHKHIVGIHGWTTGGLSDAYCDGRVDGFFLILDRLEETLDSRIKQWDKQLKRYKTPFLQKISSHNNNMQELVFAGRLKVARDIASALAYLHSKGILYRDLKPGNIGFDAEGDVKIFDFGLSREMPKFATDMDEVYEMSGKIGTQRYMAPEVCLQEPYNQKADVYSLSLVMWEMLSLMKPFKSYSKSKHRLLVIEGGERPLLEPEWPAGVEVLLQRSWSDDVDTRPTMAEFHNRLVWELQDLRGSGDQHNKSKKTKRRSWRAKVGRPRNPFNKSQENSADTAEDSTSILSGLTSDTCSIEIKC